MREEEVEKLRAVVRDCLGKHLYSSAIFFADKLATLAGNATDLYMQASLAHSTFLIIDFFGSANFHNRRSSILLLLKISILYEIASLMF